VNGQVALILGLAVAAGIGLLRWRAVAREAQAAAERLREANEREKQLARSQAAAEERERIFQDLHDDIGAKLLDLALTAKEPRHADLARAVLQDLRDVVSRSRGTPGTLHEVLGEIRAETEGRLETVSVGFTWEQDESLPDPQFDHGQSLHLARIVREAVSNAVRHASATHLRVRARALGEELVLDITDDGGSAVGAAKLGSGRGTSGMQARAGGLKGQIRWDPGTTGGTKVVLRMPLPR
jgi:signal transduction histidine kinase